MSIWDFNLLYTFFTLRNNFSFICTVRNSNGRAFLTILLRHMMLRIVVMRSTSLFRLISSRKFGKQSLFHLNNKKRAKSFIPDPTWSIQELRLSPDPDKLLTENNEAESVHLSSTNNLKTLAKRSLIDIDQLSPEIRSSLQEDVNGIMQCLSILTEEKFNDNENVPRPYRENVIELSDADIYDAPRGLSQVCLENTSFDIEEHEETRLHLLESVNHKILRVHNNGDRDEKGQNEELYFSVKTGTKDDCS